MEMPRRNRWLVFWLSFVAAYQAFIASSGLTQILDSRVTAILSATAGALSAGTAVYVAGGKSLDEPAARSTQHHDRPTVT